MMDPLLTARISSQIRLPEAPKSSEPGRGGEFGSMLTAAIGKTEQSRQEATRAIGDYLTGQGGELHGVVIATQRAEVDLELFLQVRNKVVQAYQEIMRMQM